MLLQLFLYGVLIGGKNDVVVDVVAVTVFVVDIGDVVVVVVVIPRCSLVTVDGVSVCARMDADSVA